MAANPRIPLLELHIETEKTPAETIFRCEGKLTSSTAAQFREPIHEAITASKRVVLDLSKVKNMDSSGLGVLVSLWVSAKRAGCELKLISLSERVSELLHLTSLDKLFAISRFPDKPSF
jgi:anti-anti-sigma factor